MISDNKIIIWLWLPVALFLAIAEPVWLQLKQICKSDSELVQGIKTNFSYLKSVYLDSK